MSDEYTLLLDPHLPEGVDHVPWLIWTLTREEITHFRDRMVEIGQRQVEGEEFTGLFGIDAMPEEFEVVDFRQLDEAPEGIGPVLSEGHFLYRPPVEVGPDVLEGARTGRRSASSTRPGSPPMA